MATSSPSPRWTVTTDPVLDKRLKNYMNAKSLGLHGQSALLRSVVEKFLAAEGY
jgi:hypothetical protein